MHQQRRHGWSDERSRAFQTKRAPPPSPNPSCLSRLFPTAYLLSGVQEMETSG
ncbi:hypothetical protein M405DRAFT_813813 [Rhizopogon salebrosus TDB-379]|nr:hypothetical protein M405DRAFT_813813 [Rhizopogon salebrosus TDB-379]